jgi:hypothetical protein
LFDRPERFITAAKLSEMAAELKIIAKKSGKAVMFWISPKKSSGRVLWQ